MGYGKDDKMLVYLIRSQSVTCKKLPLNIRGNSWISYINDEGETINIINIEAKDNKWFAKSNDEAQIYDENHYMPEIPIEFYKLYELRVKKENMYIMTFPLYDTSFGKYNISKKYFSIGKTNCDVIYNNSLISDTHARIFLNGSDLMINSFDKKFGTYVNGKKIDSAKLKCGDLIFILGLKLIYMGEFFLINNPNNKVNLNGQIFTFIENLNENNKNASDTVQEDMYATLYDENDYFEKSPRFITKFEKKQVIIDPPPEAQDKNDMPLLYTIGPMMTMGMTSMVMLITGVSSLATGEKTLIQALPTMIMSLAMLLTMVFWPILSTKYKRKMDRIHEEERQRKYKKYLMSKAMEIQFLMDQEKNILLDNNISLEECQNIILNRKRNLWERETYQEDFLTIRLGIGNKKPNLDIKYPEEHFTLEEDNLKQLLKETVQRQNTVTGVPIKLSLAAKNISAIIGERELSYSFLESLLLQIMTFQSYRDLKIVFITSKENHRFEYLKNSLHLFTDDMTMRFYGDNSDDIKQISNYLSKVFNARMYSTDDKISTIDYHNYSSYYLIIADDFEAAKTTSIVKEILSSPINYGFSVIFRSTNLSKLPKECSTFINISGIEGKTSGVFENELVADKQQLFEADLNIKNRIDLPKCISAIAKIPLRIQSGANKLPKVLSFLEMYNVGKVEQLNSLYRWKENDPTISLNAPVGVDENGELFKLNLHEKVHGPHGLIAGMTGSGKSEFIITYILSMAINYHPYEVSFVLIDYKGGGLAGAFENRELGIKLPHLAGTITNLDTVEMNRALASIQSELRRRQKLFNEARDKLGESTIDIYKYQKFFREGKVETPIPHLFIISDEFAELKMQQPEFMKELISTARIGRSLGVHLILATQKPSGIVDDQIWSNSKFRVCLKVQDKADSKDMIGNADAASLVDVGRFYLQVGYNEYFGLGQSAWTGAPYFPEEKRKKKVDTSIQFINNIGEVIKSINNDIVTIKPQGEEINNIIKYLISISTNIKVNKLWLNPIPALIYVDDLAIKYNYKSENNIINPIVGEFDDPDNQSQGLLTLNLSKDGNTIIYGGAGSGKEDFLATTIYSIIKYHSPLETNIYILDFGSEVLHCFKDAPQVGDVVSSSEEEKVRNLFKLLKSIIDMRIRILAEYNGDFKLYNSSNEIPLPTIVVVINNYEAFSELYEDCNQFLTIISRDCFKYGIIIIMSASNGNSVRYKLSQNFKNQIPLQLNDEYDYVTIIGKTNGIVPSNIVGRGLVKLDAIYEFQTASIKPKAEQIDYIKEFCQNLKSESLYVALKIPTLPSSITVDSIKNKITKKNLFGIGIYKDDLEIAVYNFKKNYASIISSFDFDLFDGFIDALIEEISSKLDLTVVDTKEIVEKSDKYTYINNNFDNFVKQLNDLIDKQTTIYRNNNYDTSSLDGENDKIYIISGFGTFYNRLSQDMQKTFENLLVKGIETDKNYFILLDTADQFKTFEYSEWYKKAVTKNSGIWIGSGINEQSIIKVMRVGNIAKKEIPNGFGFVVKQGTAKYTKLLEGEKDEQ